MLPLGVYRNIFSIAFVIKMVSKCQASSKGHLDKRIPRSICWREEKQNVRFHWFVTWKTIVIMSPSQRDRMKCFVNSERERKCLKNMCIFSNSKLLWLKIDWISASRLYDCFQFKIMHWGWNGWTNIWC